jgi:hypothetical protein
LDQKDKNGGKKDHMSFGLNDIWQKNDGWYNDKKSLTNYVDLKEATIWNMK